MSSVNSSRSGPAPTWVVRFVWFAGAVAIVVGLWNVLLTPLPHWLNGTAILVGATALVPSMDWELFKQDFRRCLRKHTIGVYGTIMLQVSTAILTIKDFVGDESYASILDWVWATILFVSIVLLWVDFHRNASDPKWLDSRAGRWVQAVASGVFVATILLILVDLFVFPLGVIRE